jgi:hypothetical protein
MWCELGSNQTPNAGNPDVSGCIDLISIEFEVIALQHLLQSN